VKEKNRNTWHYCSLRHFVRCTFLLVYLQKSYLL